MRATAEQDTTERLCCGYVRVVIIAEERGASTACAKGRHDVTLLAEDYLLDISIGSGFIAYVVVSVVSVVLKLGGVGADEYLAQFVSAVGCCGRDADVDAVCPLANMTEGVLYATIARNGDRDGGGVVFRGHIE